MPCSSWLGDVSASELATGLEIQAGRDPDARQELHRRWSLMAAWFHPPTSTRTLTLLVPGYDEQREGVGFYRIHLPGMRYGIPDDLIPPRPVATEILDWAQSPQGPSYLRRRPHRLSSVRYHPPADKRVVPAMLRRVGAPRQVIDETTGWSVTMELTPLVDGDSRSGPLVLQGYFILEMVPPDEQQSVDAHAVQEELKDLFCLMPVDLSAAPSASSMIGDLQASGHLCP